METDAGDYAISTRPAVPASAPVTKKPSSSSGSGATSATPAKLEPFLLLARGAKLGAAASLITQATGAQGVHVFGELLEVQGIKDLKGSEQYAASYELLQLFAYGVWDDYLAKKDSLPPLSPAQTLKLKHLTVVSLSLRSRLIAYSELLPVLELKTIPELEDLLIAGFYQGIFTGRLDQKEERLEILSSTGRDVRPAPAKDAMEVASGSGTTYTGTHTINDLADSLTTWLGTIDSVLTGLNANINELSANSANAATRQEKQNEHLSKLVEAEIAAQRKKKEKSGAGGGGGGRGGEAFEMMRAGHGGDGGDMEWEAPSALGSGRGSPGKQERTRKRGRLNG